ncbi:MAG: Spy/CpxP family protein refolding chaperone [Aliidongia sp.]
MMFNSTKTATFSLAAATVLGALALTVPAMPAAAQDQAAPKAHAHRGAAQNPEETVESRIADLKTKLKITDAEATQWNAVADVMRENAKEAQARIEARNAATSGSPTAVDDLKNFAAGAQGHADGLKKMEAAFETLYNAMPDDQKKNADEVFAAHEGRGTRHAAAKKKAD